MRTVKMIIMILFIGVFLLFAFQNGIPVNIHFLKFTLDNIPLFIVLIAVFLMGFIWGRISAWVTNISHHKSSKKTKTNELINK